jgi:hypothetical protein
MDAGERIGFMFRASLVLFLKASLRRRQLRPPSHKNSNNPLAGEPETENDDARENLGAISFMISLLLKRRLQRQQKGFIQMINTLTRAATLGALMMAAAFPGAGPAFSQAPSQAQRDAIKSQCRSDYMAHCSSVPPGGEASLQCLQKNMSSLSSGCQSAVRAVEAPAAAAPKAESAPAAPAAATAKPATETAAPKTATPKAAAPKTAAPKNVAPKAAGSTATAAPAGVPAAAAPAAPAVIVLRPMRPREELFVLRSACGADVRSICGGVQPGGGRIVQCLATNAASLSPACKDVLGQFAAQ